jgi:hypothetical protein
MVLRLSREALMKGKAQYCWRPHLWLICRTRKYIFPFTKTSVYHHKSFVEYYPCWVRFLEDTCSLILKFLSLSNRLDHFPGPNVIKLFSSVTSWAQCYKTFYGCNLWIFIISKSICPSQAFPAYSYKTL